MLQMIAISLYTEKEYISIYILYKTRARAHVKESRYICSICNQNLSDYTG